MTGQLSPRVILVYSCFIIVCLGEAVDGDVEIIQGRISFGPCHALFFVIFILFQVYLFLYFLAVLGLRCCFEFSEVAVSRGYFSCGA